MRSITALEYKRLKVLGLLGLLNSDINPIAKEERLTFVNNIDEVKENILEEHNVWYHGDSSEIRNFFFRANSIDYNTEPIYNINKKGYFWSTVASETDIKCTHSGQPRNIVDTTSGVIGSPMIGVGSSDSVLEDVDKNLKKILKDNRFETVLTKRARPLTLVEGWGGWKINWNSNFRDTPILLYYRADSVDFIYSSNQLVGIIYRDYYQDEKKNNYILFETRYVKKVLIEEGENAGLVLPCLFIDKDLFKLSGSSKVMTPCALKDVKQLKDVEKAIMIENCDKLLGSPHIYFEDSTGDFPGRSIYTGKEDLFDDLDQCLSQSANSVRRSTPTEVWDVNYLEVDNNGMPIMPKAYDRKYIAFRGARGGDGTVNNTPVQTTQPNINFQQYSDQAIAILVQIVNGIMSPATLGIDIAKKDTGESQREKEKVTIFTRNMIIRSEQEIVKDLCEQLLIAQELQNKGTITCRAYDIYVKYSEFADASFESKIESVATAYQSKLMDEEMAVKYLYGDNVSKEEHDRLVKFMKAATEQEQQMMNPEIAGEMGGMNNNPYDQAMMKPENMVPELSNYGKLHNRSEKTDIQKDLHDKIDV